MSNDLIEVSPDLSIDDGRSLLDIAQRAESLIVAIKKIKTIVFAITNADDWVDEQGKPYLQVSGAEKIRPLFGIEWEISSTPDIDEDVDGHRTYKFEGRFTMGGKSVSIIGSRSSKSPFFSYAGKRPVHEIPMGDVEKAAYTNTIGNGITRILGIRNMTWDELEAAGISKHASRAVERNVKGAATTAPAGCPVAPKFGRDAEKPLSEVSDDSLMWYADVLAENVKDPKKAKFKSKNQDDLLRVNAELDRRSESVVVPEETPEPPPKKAVSAADPLEPQ